MTTETDLTAISQTARDSYLAQNYSESLDLLDKLIHITDPAVAGNRAIAEYAKSGQADPKTLYTSLNSIADKSPTISYNEALSLCQSGRFTAAKEVSAIRRCH